MICDKGISVKFLLVVVVVSVFVSGDAEVRCIEREREALLSFKNGLIDDYDILSSWRSSDECCEWYGVVCSNTTSHVITLQLDARYYDFNKLRGKVGSSLLELHHLHYLNLNWNDVGGGNPIPQFIGSMKQLRHLFLRFSNFVGIVPPQIGNLTNLRSLDLSFNDFGGNPIPEFIGSMKQLRHLDFSRSNFSGIVPPHIGNLTNLRSLDLSSNSLSSENLGWLSNLSLLSFLDLSWNDLSPSNWLQPILSLHSLHELHLESCDISDDIVKPSANSSSSLSILDMPNNYLTRFDWLSNISTSLVKLDLSSNALSGPIPNAIERMIRIEHLDLFNNMLRGNLDELFRNLSGNPTLKILDLAYNELNGSVPDNLGAFSALTELNLWGNNLTGSMPLSLGQLSELQVLDLYNNSLEGTLSESHFIKLHSLKTLSLSFNSFIFDIAPDWSPPFQLENILLEGCNVGPSFPKWIQTQKNFFYLDLSRANITDEVPTWLWSASPLLEILYLTHNQISGTIPDLSSTSISLIDVSYNNFSGPIPLFNPNASVIQLSGNMLSGSISSLCKIHHDGLEILDLSNNQLAEEVPNCWEKMPDLFYLNLANNIFSGEIPRSWGSLDGLRVLQLRGNKLSGELPSNLRFCHGLDLIDVGGNELTGEIPSWIGNLYQMKFLNLGRNRLHGSIPLGICNLTDIQILDLSINNLSGEIPDCFNNFTVLASQEGPDFNLFRYFYRLYYDERHPTLSPKIIYSQYSSFKWKGQESEYKKNLKFLKLIDFSSNRLTGNIPQSFSNMMGLISLNLSRNGLKGNIIPDIGDMEKLESLDLSNNQLSGKISTSLAQLHYLAFLDLSTNNFSGKIPMSTQLQSFNASRYAGNDGLCGAPLPICPEDSLRPSSTTTGENMNEKDDIFSFMQEVGISMGFGFIFGFWGVVGSLIVKKSWRNAFFNLFDDAKDWLYVRTTLFVSKWRPS